MIAGINKHNCVLSNAGLSNAPAKTGICTSLKIRFLFPVSFTIEYKVGIAEFYLYVGFGADLLKNMVTQSLKAAEIRFHTPLIWQTTSG